VLEAELVDAATALQYGLVDELLPADQVLDRALAVAHELAERTDPARREVRGWL
jgi:enoyl-CoA hydratase/carnithine racemase